jgi:diadenosine tetraphosphatase ApaH/serine/threonine PP2A family protein phosphatase
VPSGRIVMLIALFSDIHANREAFDACIAHAKAHGAEKFVFLGDFIGYGADPAYIVDRVRHYQQEGAILVKGNHDAAIASGTSNMNSYARAAIDWTRDQLNPSQKDFLAALPLTFESGEALFVHADAANPAGWIYVTSDLEADHSMDSTKQRVTFCGHVHRPQLFHKAPRRPAICFIPTSGIAIPLAKSQKYHAVIGSVGQPRDEIPSASYALYDEEKATLAFMRVAYDIERAARKIKSAGLPPILSARLFIGR